jgi:4-hydroxy-tetrahydrodipicolinate reductase
MGYLVVEWSTGNAGFAAIRGILHHPDVELVGVWGDVASATDQEATDLAALEANGVPVTQDAAALLALIPDCVCYTATAAERSEVLDDLLGILRSGANVVAPSMQALAGPSDDDATVVEALDAAANEGAASFFAAATGDGADGTSPSLMLLIDAIPEVCRARSGVLAASDLWPAQPPEDGAD